MAYTSGTENVLCSVDVPIMRHTTRATRPRSYPQRPQSTRTRPRETGRASDAGEHFTDWDADTSKPDGFVGQLVSEHAPASIIGRFGERSFHQLDAGDVTHGDEPGTSGNGGRGFVRPVLADVLDLGVDGRDSRLFAGALGKRQLGLHRCVSRCPWNR